MDTIFQEFQEQSNNLKLRSRPAIETIEHRRGSNPFLKVTFISDGEKREFTRFNKTSTNKYETRPLTPIATQAYKKDAKSKVNNKVADYLREKEYHIPGDNVGTMSI